MKLNKYKNKIIMVAAIGLGLIGGIGIFIAYPYYGKVSELKQTIYDTRLQLAMYQQQRSNAETTKQDYNKIKDDTATISKIFVNKDNIVDLISSLESIASRRALKQTINLDTTTQPTTSQSLPIRISLTGTWENNMLYLADLERLDYYFSINEFNFTKDGRDVVCAITALVYIQ